MRILALDYGTTALKASLYDGELNCLGRAAREWTYSYPAPRQIEHPVEKYWQVTASAARELTERFGGQVDAVSVTGQSETLITFDAAMKPVGEAIVWLDGRAQEERDELAARFPEAELYARTGNAAFDPVMPLLKYMWLREHAPERFAKTEKYLLLKDYIIYRLSGRLVGEHTVSCCTGYLNIVKRDWDDALLSAAGMRREQLPELAGPQDIVGRLAPEAARDMGIAGDPPVINGMLDQCASAMGAGNIAEGGLCETTGTVLAIASTLDRFEPEKLPERVLMFCHALPGRYLALPNCPTAGVLLNWLRDNVLSGEEKAAGFPLISAKVAERINRESELIMLPHFGGRLSPVQCPSATGVLYGLTLDSDRFDVARAIMEGVAFLLRENVELLRRCGAASEGIISLGGGAKSDVWLKIKADALNMTVTTLKDGESTALGCALGAMLALGAIGEGDIARHIARKASFAPDAERAKRAERKYMKYLELNRKLGFEEA